MAYTWSSKTWFLYFGISIVLGMFFILGSVVVYITSPILSSFSALLGLIFLLQGQTALLFDHVQKIENIIDKAIKISKKKK